MKLLGDLTLRYGRYVIGQIEDIICSDHTYHGTFKKSFASADDPTLLRVAEYIAFCEAWNEGTRTVNRDPPSSSEFDRYADIVSSGLWTAESPSMTIMVADAPVFFLGNEVSWRVNDVE
jgi:hypothetical protein